MEGKVSKGFFCPICGCAVGKVGTAICPYVLCLCVCVCVCASWSFSAAELGSQHGSCRTTSVFAFDYGRASKWSVHRFWQRLSAASYRIRARALTGYMDAYLPNHVMPYHAMALHYIALHLHYVSLRYVTLHSITCII